MRNVTISNDIVLVATGARGYCMDQVHVDRVSHSELLTSLYLLCTHSGLWIPSELYTKLLNNSCHMAVSSISLDPDKCEPVTAPPVATVCRPNSNLICLTISPAPPLLTHAGFR